MRQRWQRFRHRTYSHRHNRDVFGIANQRLSSVLRQTGRVHGRLERLNPYIEQQRRQAVQTDDAADWLTLLLLLVPGAAQAQEQMDNHPNGYHSKTVRLYELIDFNDAYVSTVIALDSDHLPTFNEHLKKAIEKFADTVGTRHFSEDQFDAITRGLTREIAVYKTARELGYDVRLTSRREDAMGVDMTIMDPHTGDQVNLDIKSPSSYRYRLQDLVREGRLSEKDALRADVKGYAHETNGRGNDAVDVVLMRIDANEVGEIVDFRFHEPDKLESQLEEVLHSER